ncbi:MAG: hypothetical protein RLZZ381_1468, partial [Cyanobacteriota bacterium]
LDFRLVFLRTNCHEDSPLRAIDFRFRFSYSEEQVFYYVKREIAKITAFYTTLACSPLIGFLFQATGITVYDHMT